MSIDSPLPPPSCGQTPCDGAGPYDAATGAADVGFSFLRTNFASFKISWYNLYPSGNPNRGVSPNWSSSQFAVLTDHGTGNGISVMFAPGRDGSCGCGGASNNTYWFDNTPPVTEELIPGPYAPLFGCHATLTKPDDWQLVEEDGTVTVFDKSTGLIKSQTTPGGQTTEYSASTSPDRITEMRRTVAGKAESRTFVYNSGDLQYVTLRTTNNVNTDPIIWTEIRRLELVYYTTNETGKGNDGDLKLIKQQLPGTTPGTWVDDKIHLFRYYTSGEQDGFQHGLKYVLSPEGYERMSDPEGASNVVLAPYASVYYEYDSTNRRVTTVAVDGGQTTETIAWADDNELESTEFTPDNWLRKAVITMPNGLERTVYSNHVGQDLLIDDRSGNDNWITYRKYNADYRLEQLVHPSAITSYSGSSDNLAVQIKTNAGLIEVFDYNSTNGYLEFEKVQNGTSEPEIDIKEITYTTSPPVGGNSIYVVSQTTLYDSASGDATTNISYTSWHSGTFQPETVTTTLPQVSTSQNGTGQDETTAQTYDIQGRLSSSTDARGMITTYTYDEVTGAQTSMVQDDGGLDLTTTMTNDDLGRQTESVGPEHDINRDALRTANWTVYQDADDEVWSGRGYKIDTDYTLVNPVSIQKLDKNGRVFSSIQATRGSGVENSGKLSPSDTFPRSSWIRWTRTIYGNGGRVTAVRVYHNIPSLGEGNSTVNYDETTFDYDSMGRQNRVKSPNGTITRTVFDVRGLVDSVWVGTDDNGATDTDPTGNSAQNNNMKKIVQNEYDGGADGGDGNLTKTTRPVDDTSSNDRITEMQYDWRDRLTTTITTDGSNEFHNINTLDNLGRTIASEVKRDDSPSPVLIAKNETKFDTRGRVYRTLNYAVSDAGVAGNSLQSNTWFDENGNVIKSKPSGSEAFTKTTYDAINRPTNSNYGYYDATLSDNVIFEESEIEYDDASNVTFTTSKQRFHNATGSGALNGPSGSQPKSRDSYVLMWYDGIGRMTESANYGTNAGTVPTRSNSAPAASDTVQMSESVYNADGELEDVIDPLGKTDRTEYDDAGAPRRSR